MIPLFGIPLFMPQGHCSSLLMQSGSLIFKAKAKTTE